MTTENFGTRVSDELTKILAEIPARLDIVGFVRNAHARLSAVAPPETPAPIILDKIVEVLREIASHAVAEFEHRTGQQFLWVDEPDPAEDPENALMHFGLDEKGNVTF